MRRLYVSYENKKGTYLREAKLCWLERNVLIRLQGVHVSSGTRAECYLSEVLPKICVIFEVGVI
jgi:hypothetical protein